MTPSVRRLPFRLIGMSSDVHTRYLEEDPDLRSFLGVRPSNVEELLHHAPVGARRLLAPEALSTAVQAYAERYAAPEAVRENARALGDAETCAVVTGQQPGMFGGPLFTIHKAATAVRLAREIQARRPGLRVVPVFWNHTDDHDIDEVNRAFAVNTNLEVQRIRLELPRSGRAIRDIEVGRPMEQAIAALSDLLPQTEFRDWAFDAITPRSNDDTFGSLLARLLFKLFGDDGLVVIEPRDLPPPAFDVLPRWSEAANRIRDVIRSSSDHLVDLGIDVAIDPNITLMFQHTAARCVALSDGDVQPRATALSPGVLLRPLWQDTCLPTIASVVGPGELSYLAIAGKLYRELGVPAPVFVPRASLTLVEPSLKKLLAKFGWDLPDLAKSQVQLANALATDEGSPVEDALEDLAGSTKRRITELLAQVRKMDGQLVGPTERARNKVVDELMKLANKIRHARQNREGTGVRQIRRLCSHLRPRGRPQERVLTVVPFLVTHGEQLSRDVLAAADPFSMDHGVVEL